MPQHTARARSALAGLLAGLLAALIPVAGCSSESVLDIRPPTIEPARPALSPPPVARPAGQVLPLAGRAQSALFDPSTETLAVLNAAGLNVADDQPSAATVELFGRSGPRRSVALPAAVTALTGDGAGTAYAATRGGVVTVDLAAGTAERTAIPGHDDTDFTAVARRADGRLVLGSATGAAYTLTPQLTVAEEADVFARVDAIVTVGQTAVVLDRGQTSVTALGADGAPEQALRAGLGATTMVADPAGRVLVADTRGGQLLVFTVDPLIERQAFPVGEAPYGLAGSARWTWVSQTAANTVIGYDLATGIPVEKVRYPTVQQPNALAFDEASDTLYVVSGSGAGVQVITAAGSRR